MDNAFQLLENRKEREINGEIAMDAINESKLINVHIIITQENKSKNIIINIFW